MSGVGSGASADAAPRRRAARQRPGWGVAVLPAVAVLTVALLGAVELVHPEPVEAARAGRAGLDDLTQVCLPDPATRSTRGSTEVLTLGVDLPELTSGGGVEASAPDPGGAGEAVPTARGTVHTVPADPSAALRVVATGDAAPARSTLRTDLGTASGDLAVLECLPARARWWFTGAGAGLDHRSRLVLANVDEGPAVVDVTVHGPDGVVESVGTRGMTLAPGETRVLDLVEVAPQTDELAVHVEASRGRVAAAVADSSADRAGANPGHEWLPPQADPTRRTYLAPVPDAADRRTLVVANPSGREALVEVGVAGEGGTFAPVEGADLRVPPGAVATSDLTDALGDGNNALTLRSPVPVVATLRSSARRGGIEQVSYAATVSPSRTAAVAVSPSGGTLQVTGGSSGAEASVRAFAADGGEVGSTTLTLDPGATTAWELPRGTGHVLVTPDRGAVWGGVVTSGPGLSQVPLRALLVALPRPTVGPVLVPRVGTRATGQSSPAS